MMSYGKVFEALKSASAEAWQTYTHHRFVSELGSGQLSKEAFLHYLKQDYVFLMHFSRAWALAVVKSETHAEMMAATATLNALVHDEIKLHVDICTSAGINQEDLFQTKERPENLAYTRFVLEAGQRGDLLDLLCALAPCVMGYGEIGRRLSETSTAETYRPWIETYASSDYQTACSDFGHMLDDAVLRRIGVDFDNSPRWERLCKTFATATELEVGFWDMGLKP